MLREPSRQLHSDIWHGVRLAEEVVHACRQPLLTVPRQRVRGDGDQQVSAACRTAPRVPNGKGRAGPSIAVHAVEEIVEEIAT